MNDWWDRIGTARWQHVVLALAVLVALVAICFAPMCSVSIQ